LESGLALSCVAGDAVDFLKFPPGILPKDVRSYLPGWENGMRTRDRKPDVVVAPYSWCLYDARR
jgi:hypothetical protein